jgi:hypothetical protein
MWRISDSLSAVRLTALTLLSLGIIVASLIVMHDLWERSGPELARDQVILFNAATGLTLVIGVASLSLALFCVTLAGAGLLITPGVFSAALGSDVGVGNYLALAWLASSLGTLAGALGAGLESDVAIREAAYARRPAGPAPPEQTADSADA